MPKNPNIKKVVVIGQAAEFDYAGTQACRSLKEEGLCVVLINSNPATIMTDKDIADKVYIEPLTVDVVKAIIEKEKPDSLLPTLGGQAALNIAMELDESGFLREHDVLLIGTSSTTIKKAEDRLEFKKTMEKIHEPVAPSEVVTTVQGGLNFVKKIGYPVVLRPAYTLGGSGGGIANNEEEFKEILMNGLRLSRVGQVLVERCIAGWKEIEYEVMRDANGTCITVCNMENLDPVGVHTGDSIVVAPSQTLGDKEYQMLRSSALNIISELNIKGGCNVQFALNPNSFEYCVIEVNPRVSRSSALASKATGYPIAKVSAKIALGYNLDEIKNAITKKTYASFEPALDYVVVKIPRLPFDKFIAADHDLTTQMKATGEVMSICTNFEGALMKALRSLEQHVDSLWSSRYKDMTDEEVIKLLGHVDDRRIYVIAEAIRRGISYDQIYDITKIDRWFIDKIHNLVKAERKIIESKGDISKELMKEIKRVEFPDKVIARLTGKTEKEIRQMRYDYGVTAHFKMVDTCAAEFDAMTPYYYSCFDSLENEVAEDNSKKKVMVLGSGPIRIGQGIEFDYCSVHSTWAFERKGYETIIVNNNPETVSTDFDIADRLYFEPLTAEDVESIVDIEKPDGAIVQFGGQTAIKLTKALTDMGADFKFLEKKGHLPVEVTGAAFGGKKPKAEVSIDISESTQFLSALMMTAPMLESGLKINITSKKTDGSYIRITSNMMRQFGCEVDHEGAEYVIPADDSYVAGSYQIEPDVSAACYFYAAAALTGGYCLVKNVRRTSMQGDMKFLDVLKQLGCTVTEEREGISVTGPAEGEYDGVDVDMNDFSDQTMTLAAIAPFAKTPTIIRNIEHIRFQESDRIEAVANELNSLCIDIKKGRDRIEILPGKVKPGVVKTYSDHRMAMAFALIGLKVDGIIIDDYECCAKTFENYFEVLEAATRE